VASARSLVIGTAGHIDHGKSSLVLALTGTDPDRLKEEKARGITIDLGFAHWDDGAIQYAFVDVPGHERFVRNMLAGVGGIDGVLLVVAADESVMPQTREHFDICRLLGIRRAVVALTKCDLADHDTRELVRLEVAELLQGSPMAGAPMIPVSARTGEGLDALRAALRTLAAGAPPRGREGPVRLPIDRAFSIHGFGTVVTGTLTSGRLHLDDELVLLPGDRVVKVRGVQVHGAARAEAEACQRVALNLSGIDVANISRGHVLASRGGFRPTRVIDADIELLPGARPLAHGTRIRFHQGTSEVLGRVAVVPVGDTILIEPGARGAARIRLESPTVLTRGDRFVLRAYSPAATIGGGIVLDPQGRRGGVRSAATADWFRRLQPSEADHPDDEAIVAMVTERGGTGLVRSDLTARTGISPAMVDRTVARLARAGVVDDLGPVLVAPALRADLAARVEALVRAYHQANPLSDGMPREEVRERLFRRATPVLFERVLADLAEARLVGGRDRLASSSHRLALSPAEQKTRDAIERLLEHARLLPPDVAGLAEAAGADRDLVERMLSLLVRQKAVVKLGTLYFHAEALSRLKDEMRALKTAARDTRVDVATFKERYGISRKFAIPLLEYLDRERITRRQGDARILL
jgi:selenocysteine-specific elongation factor